MWANTTLVKNLCSHHSGMVPFSQDLCQPPGALFFLGTGVDLCQHQPYTEPITTGPYALKEKLSEDYVYTEKGPNLLLMQSRELPK